MWKVAGGILIFLMGVLIGAQGMKLEIQQRERAKEQIRQEFVFELPHSTEDAKKKLLYLYAEIQFLEVFLEVEPGETNAKTGEKTKSLSKKQYQKSISK